MNDFLDEEDLGTDDTESEDSSFADPIETPPPRRNGLPLSLLGGLVDTESGDGKGNFNPSARSSAGAMGAAQVTPYMWKHFGEGNPDDPEDSLRTGEKILMDEYTRFSGNEDLALAAYNAGSPNVINAMKRAGYELKDAAYIAFDDIKPFLPAETQKYVPRVREKQKNYAHLDNENPEFSAAEDSLNADPNANAFGTKEELWSLLEPVIADPEFNTLSASDALAKIKETYDSAGKPGWTDEAKGLVKELATATWEAAPPQERPNYGELVGAVPTLDAEEIDPKKKLEAWKQSKREEVSNTIDPSFLGKSFDEYLDEAASNEEQAHAYRTRGKVGDALHAVGGVSSGVAKGFVGGFTTAASAIPRIAGYEETADSIDSIANFVPDASRDQIFQVDSEGYLKRDEYGRPLSTWQGVLSQAVGQVGSFFTGAAGLKAVGVGAKGVGTFLGGANVLSSANQAYQDAAENGATIDEARLAALYSLPSAAVDTLGDMVVLGGGKAWVKGLSSFNKAKAIGTQMAKGAVIAGTTNAAQQGMQDAGTSLAIGKNIMEGSRIAEAGVAGALVGGVVHGVTADYAVKPEERPMVETPDDTTRTRTEQKALPAPEERLGLPAPETLTGLPGPNPKAKQLGAPEAKAPIQGSSTMPGLDLPDPDEQIRIAQEFEKFQSSQESERVISIRSPKDVDPELLWQFGFRGEVDGEGRLRIMKETNHVPLEDTTDLDTVNKRIEELSKKLATAPKPAEATELITRRQELNRQIKEATPEAKAQADVHDQYSQQLAVLTKQLNELQAMRRENMGNKNMAMRQLINSEIATTTQQLLEVKNVLADVPGGKDLAEMKVELRNINDSLKRMLKPTYVNDIKAMEVELKDLTVKQSLLSENDGSRPTGLHIGTKDGDRFIVPLNDKWHIVDGEGNAFSKGHDSFADALDTARGIIATADEGKFNAGVTSINGGMNRPLIFKRRKEVPWYIVRPTKPDPNAAKWAVGENAQKPSETKAAPKGEGKKGRGTSAPQGKQGIDALTEMTGNSYARGEGSAKVEYVDTKPQADSNPDIDQAPPRKKTYRLDKSRVNQGQSDKDFGGEIAFTKDSEKVVNPRDVVAKAAKLLKSLYKYGKNASKKNPYLIREGGRGTRGSKNALAYINYAKRYVWSRESNDITSIIHEMAHGIQMELFDDLTALDPKVQAALKDTAFTYYPGTPEKVAKGTMDMDTVRREGWTMFIQHYMSGQKVHPRLLDFYNGDFRRNFPELHKNMEDLRKLSFDYFNMTDEAWVKAFTSAAPFKESIISLDKREQLDNWVDQRRVLKEIDAIAGTKLADTAEAVRGEALEKTRVIVHGERFTDFDGNVIDNTETLKNILKPVKAHYDLLTQYMLSKYTLARAKRGQVTGQATDEAGSLVRKIEKKAQEDQNSPEAKIINTAQKVYNWQEQVLNLAASRSTFMQEYVNNIRNDNLKYTGFSHGYYIPFAREMASSPKGYEKGAGGAPGNDPLKSFKGSHKRIINPLTRMEANARSILSAAEKRFLFDKIVSIGKGDVAAGAYIRPIPREMVPTFKAKVDDIVQKLNEKLKAEGMDAIELDNAIGEDLLTFFRPEMEAPRAADGYQTFAYKQPGGKVEFYEVHPRLLKAFDNSIPDFVKTPFFQWMYMKPATVLRAGATSFRAAYQLRNLLFRDFATAFRRADTINPFYLIKEIAQSLGAEAIHSISGGKWTSAWSKKLEDIGAQSATYQGFRKSLEADIEKATGKKLINLGASTFDYIDGVLGVGERATRRALAKIKAKEMGITADTKLSPAQRIELLLAYKRGTTNFQVQGKTAKVINFGIPFFTARIAELSQLENDWKSKPGKNAAYAAGFLAAGIYQAVSNNEEKWWQNIEPTQKMSNFMSTMKVNGEDRVVAVPLETVSGMFNGLGVIIGESLFRNDDIKPEVREQIVAYLKNYLPTSSPADFLGPVLKELAAQGMNEDFFTGRTIVPKGLEGAPASAQYVASTTELAKELGQRLDIAPARIDHAIKATFPAALDWVKQVENVTGVKPINENKGALSVITSAFTRPGYVASTLDRSTVKFYEAEQKASQNRDIETKSEGDIRKKLGKIKERLSDINVILSAEPDDELRQELYRKKANLLELGLRISQGEQGNPPTLPETSQAKRIREERKKERAVQVREAMQ